MIADAGKPRQEPTYECLRDSADRLAAPRRRLFQVAAAAGRADRRRLGLPWSGWGKLNALPRMIENFRSWGIPYPEILTPFVSGVEFVGGILLPVGLFTRVAAAPLIAVMVVAIVSAKWGDVDSLETLLGFEEMSYLALFLWLAIAGPGPVSLDYLLTRGRRDRPAGSRIGL
jgi:putative oxidoreductase